MKRYESAEANAWIFFAEPDGNGRDLEPPFLHPSHLGNESFHNVQDVLGAVDVHVPQSFVQY